MPRHSPCALCSLTIFWNYAFSNLRSVLFPLSRIDNLFEIVIFLPKTFVLRIKTFEFLYFSHQYFLCSIFKIPDIASDIFQFLAKLAGSRHLFAHPSGQGSGAHRFSFAYFSFFKRKVWWAQVDSNHRPHAYQACALTT